MLVISRRANEGIVFPSLGIWVPMLRLTGRGARVGIEAPAEVTRRSPAPASRRCRALIVEDRRLWDAMQASLRLPASPHAN